MQLIWRSKYLRYTTLNETLFHSKASQSASCDCTEKYDLMKWRQLNINSEKEKRTNGSDGFLNSYIDYVKSPVSANVTEKWER